MNNSNSKTHNIDSIFSILLFFLFAACAIILVLIGASVYEQVTANMDQNSSIRTSLSYISEKVRQNDEDGSMEIKEIEDQPVLVLHQNINNESYVTYIYNYNNGIMELYMKESANVSLSGGTVILDNASCSFRQINPALYQITASIDDTSSDILIGVHDSNSQQ